MGNTDDLNIKKDNYIYYIDMIHKEIRNILV